MNFTAFMLWMLDGSGFYTRRQWAEFLSVQESDLRNWTIADVPPPEKLRAMRRMLIESEYPGRDTATKRFAEVETVPLHKLEDRRKIQFENVNSLAEYICLPVAQGLNRRIPGFTVEQRERVFNAARREIEAIQAETKQKAAT